MDKESSFNDKVRKLLLKYKDRLNDISRRNRAVRLSRIVQRKTFDIASLYYIDNERPIKLLKKVFFEKKKFNLIGLNVKDRKESKILRNIMYLKRDIDFIEKEKGLYECYLGFPFVQGNFYDGSFFRAPLFLLPITINVNRKINKVVIKAIEDQDLVINKTFLLAFNKYNKGYKNVDINSLSIPPEGFIKWAINLFKSLNLDVDLSLFSGDKLMELSTIKKEEVPTDKIGKIEFLPIAVIGEFNQLNNAVNKDYQEILEKEISNDLLELVFNNLDLTDLEERYTDEKLVDSPEEKNFFISKLDVSQEQILIKAREGKGIVIRGPPGTGKSEVIANLISDNLMRGKKILLVCEKRAALDVVNNRLGNKNMNKFCILVHDPESDRSRLFRQIANVLENYDSLSTSISDNKILNKFKELSNSFDNKLNNLKKIIHYIYNESQYGISLHELYNNSKRNTKYLLELPKSLYNKYKNKDLLNSIEKISSLAKNFYRFENKEYPFYKRLRLTSNFDDIEFKKEIEKAIYVIESFEESFYNNSFKKDLSLIKGEFNIKSLLNVIVDLKYLQKYEKKITRFFDRKWWRLKFKYDKLIKESDINSLIERWDNIDRNIKKIYETFNYFKKIFNEEFISDFENNIFNFRSNLYAIKQLTTIFKDIDNLILFDIKLNELTEEENIIAKHCFSTIPYRHDVDMKKEWEDTIKNTFYLHWINKLESSYPQVKEFTNDTYKDIVAELNKIIDQKISLVPRLLDEKTFEKYIRLKWEGYDGDRRRKNYNKFKDLLHEVNKKRKRMTMRQLFSHFRHQLLEIFPCWMCSPETVSSIFPLHKDVFDIVIFDEASQTRLEKAIPSIIRAKRLIVAGDEKQLPPSRFFESSFDDDEDVEDYDEEQLLSVESLLERAKTVLPVKRLEYHYRSKFKELIDFSNYAFYDASLKTIPRNIISKEPPISFIKVNGEWHNQVNEKEAREVIKLIKKLILNNKRNNTFGVITFNNKQAMLIQDLLYKESRNDPIFAELLEKERNRYNNDEYVGLFVKNIENVQGDERDVIIISISYGYDITGKFRYKFGPLNGMYGQNRLNVAISRAKYKIYLFASFSPDEFRYAGSQDGPRLLKKYLNYAYFISNNQSDYAKKELLSLLPKNDPYVDEIYDVYDSDFEGEVRDALVELGYKVKTQIGCKGYRIDLAIVDPRDETKFLVGIECDGASYHSSLSAKERDLYRQKVLESYGWVILRVWSRDWWNNQEAEIRRLDREIKKLMLES